MEPDEILERSLKLLDETIGSPRTSNYAVQLNQNTRQRKRNAEDPETSGVRQTIGDWSITMNTGELTRLCEGSHNTSGMLLRSDPLDAVSLDMSRIRKSDTRDFSITMNSGKVTGLYEGSPAPSRRLLTSRDFSVNKFGASRTRELNTRDLSVTLRPGEMTEFLSGSINSTVTNWPLFKEVGRNNTPNVRKSDINNLSITLNPGELDSMSATLTGLPMLKEESEQLYGAFLECLQNHQSTGQVIDTIGSFAQTCSNILDILRENSLKGLRSKYAKDICWLEMERNNWRLLYCLYQNRLNIPKDFSEEDNAMLVENAQLYMSEKEVVKNLYRTDNKIRECQLVVDWLEKNAADEYEGSVKVRLGHYMDKTVAWENTLHQLQNKEVVYASSRPIITSLDPDAPLRHGEKGHLHDLDIEDESRLLSQVFLEIRCGRLEKAQELCTHCGQSWRAATLEGWKLHHDPNYSNNSKLEKLAVEGNPHRDIWKIMAWKLAEDQRAPTFARAIHGILCGNLQSVLPVCKGWEDLLWAFTRVLIDNRVEKEIRSNVDKPYAHMPDLYWNFKMTMADIFSELGASKQPEVRQSALTPERVIQKLLILNKIAELMEKMLEWVKSGDCSPQLIRFFAHLVLTMRLMGQSQHDEKGNEIIKAYVQILMQQEDPQLVAYYTATLPQQDQVTLYADFLQSVTDSEQRRNCLEAAESVDLQVEAITQRVVENIRNKERYREDQLQLELTNETMEEDLEKISALEWIVMYPQQRAEAMWQANALIRRFLTAAKLEAARMAFNKIPMDSVEMVFNQYDARMDDSQMFGADNLPVKVSVSVREFLCHKAYLDAQEGFSDWFHHYHNAKPKPLPKLQEGASFTDKVAYDHRVVQYNKELERWKTAMNHQTKSVKEQLYNVLVFPEGWLIDNELEDTLRQQQLKSLRSLCIPKIVLLLHTVLHSMAEHTEAVQLADLIVSEQYKLYQVYNKQQLRDLLAKLTESSLALLDQGKDPWGCPVV